MKNMMKRAAVASTVGAAMLLAAVPAQAQLVYDFELNGDTANAGSGPGTLTNNGAAQGATGLTFGANQGLTLTGATPLSSYTIDLGFRFDDTNGYRKIADFFNAGVDYGLYNLNQGLVHFPFDLQGGTAIEPGVLTRVTFSRDAAGMARGYVNGVEQVAFDDSVSLSAVFGSTVAFFQDDAGTGGREASSGYVDYIRVFGTALTPDQAVLPGVGGVVPEPATWALMIMGFGAVGGALRRRSRGGSAFA